ncbi:MAG: peptidase [Lentisphaerae bacterium]|nr:peptidase [Lentisphaerota bacterium]
MVNPMQWKLSSRLDNPQLTLDIEIWYNKGVKIIFLFIDGVGMREAAADNPVNEEVCPTLMRLISRHAKPIDACLGVDGLPQSATGQATMFTGVNCSAAMGRHCEGFPGPSLRRIIEENNLFLQLKKRGLAVRFADAYLVDSADDLAARRFKSVTTVMALTTPEVITTVDDLKQGRALMQDLTRETIQERYPDCRVISPKRAAEDLAEIAHDYDFTLYEFFQTDVSGHSMDYARACAVLRTYDQFLSQLIRLVEIEGITLVMTADHGNIECMTERGHTRSPVPFIAYGPRESDLRDQVESLIDVTPALLRVFDSVGR